MKKYLLFYFLWNVAWGKKNQFLTLENCFNLSVIVKENTEICSVVTHMWMNNEDLKNNSSHSTSIHFSVDVEGLKKKESFIRVMLGIEIFFPVLNILKLARFYYFHLTFLKIYFILKKNLLYLSYHLCYQMWLEVCNKSISFPFYTII